MIFIWPLYLSIEAELNKCVCILLDILVDRIAVIFFYTSLAVFWQVFGGSQNRNDEWKYKLTAILHTKNE